MGQKTNYLAVKLKKPKKAGKKVSRKKVVAYLGPQDRYDDGQPDYLERLRQSFRDGAPLIPELLPYVGEKPAQKYIVSRLPKAAEAVLECRSVLPRAY